MATVEHYKKKQECDNINRLLSYIKEKGSVSFTEGKAFLNVSSVTMSSYLKKLLEEKKIEHYYVLEPGKKRRKERYRIKPENQDKVNAQIGKYEAIKFIEGISNHIYVYREKDGKAIAAFISQIDKEISGFSRKESQVKLLSII